VPPPLTQHLNSFQPSETHNATTNEQIALAITETKPKQRWFDPSPSQNFFNNDCRNNNNNETRPTTTTEKEIPIWQIYRETGL
jgi:hypothetical protein